MQELLHRMRLVVLSGCFKGLNGLKALNDIVVLRFLLFVGVPA